VQGVGEGGVQEWVELMRRVAREAKRHEKEALARHIWPLQQDFPAHTLAFVGLNIRVVPFPIFEAQARCIVRVLSDPACLSVPHELELVRARDADLRSRFPNNPEEVAKQWHKLPDNEQFAYRTELLAFAHCPDYAVEPWAREFYDIAKDLRREWRAIEARGEGEKWVQGVGEGGVQEWVELMRRVAREAKRHEKEAEVEESREKVHDPGRV